METNLNKAELQYLINDIEGYVNNCTYYISNIENLVTKNKDGSLRKNSRRDYKVADRLTEDLKFFEPLLAKLKAIKPTDETQ